MKTIKTHPDSLIRSALALVVVTFLSLLALPSRAADRIATDGLPGTTIVLFADRPMSSALWTDIQNSVQGELSFGSPEMQSLAIRDSLSVHIVRGDQLPVGLQVQSSISVYLHGDCNLSVHASFNSPHRIAGVLGWVAERHGDIQPFIHIDCALIGQMLRSRAAFLKSFYDQAQRTRTMAVAIARVLLHEYIHITTQSSAHTKHGLTKSQFNVEDLTAPIPEEATALRATKSSNPTLPAPEPLTRPATGR